MEGDDSGTGLTAVAAGAVTTLTLAVAFGLLAVGYPFFWVAFPVGFGGVLPLAVGLARRYETEAESDSEREGPTRSGGTDEALARLRDRYARGEIGEAEFERRLERLLETESVGTAREAVERRAGADGDAGPDRRDRRDRATDARDADAGTGEERA